MSKKASPKSAPKSPPAPPAEEVWVVRRGKGKSAVYLNVIGNWGSFRLAARFPTPVTAVNWSRTRCQIDVKAPARVKTIRASSLFATNDTRAVKLKQPRRPAQSAAA